MADPKQLEILKQSVDVWNRYVRSGVKINLSRANLLRAELRDADLLAADFRTVINDAGEREFTDLGETVGLT